MRSREILKQLPATVFLNWESFRLTSDTDENQRRVVYEHGLRIGKEYDTVHIDPTGTWSAGGPTYLHKRTNSQQIIGRDAYTADLLRGFLESGARIVVHRFIDGAHKMFTIQERINEDVLQVHG